MRGHSVESVTLKLDVSTKDMYGFSGYSCNSYASPRPSRVLGPAIQLTMQILKSGYGVVNALMLRFKQTILTLQ
jgi:hypothetical protein